MPDTKITALTAISTVDPAADPLVIVDVSDTSMAASGTTKKITSNQILNAGGTATLASATITGNLTVDTNTLFVDATSNRVGVGTATPYSTLHANSAIAAANFDWTATFTAPTAGLLATSNNSSAWIRIATLDSNPTHDPYVNFLTSGGQNWSVGIDNSDSDKFKIALSNGFTGSNEIFAVDPSAVFSWYDGAGGTRMTLNSTGLGVGVSPAVLLDVQSASAVIRATSSTGTNTSFATFANTGGAVRVGAENSAGGGLFTGSSAYSAVLGTTGAYSAHIGTNGSVRMTVKSTGQVRFVPLAADPAGAEAGDVYYNSTSNKLKCYNGTTWNDLF